MQKNKRDTTVWKLMLARQQGKQEGMKFAIRNYSPVLLLVLKDKFGFTASQLQDVALYTRDTFDSVLKGYVSLEDIAQVLKEEDGLDLKYDGKEV